MTKYLLTLNDKVGIILGYKNYLKLKFKRKLV